MKLLLLGLTVFVTACGQLPGPSVPEQPGQNLQTARMALRDCSGSASQGGKNAVVGSYVGSIIIAGVIIGPLVVLANEDNIRVHGEYSSVDKCLAKRGFKRRNLTPEEVTLLNNSTAAQRQLLLNHLINGGTLDTYSIVRS